jgi:CTP-dependent riboflavin kinase
MEQCQAKLGFAPYPGTVNLEVLPEDLALWVEQKLTRGAILIPPDPAFCDAVCYPARIAGQVEAASITPHVPGYPEAKLELLAPINVTDALGLSLGQEVEVYFQS